MVLTQIFIIVFMVFINVWLLHRALKIYVAAMVKIACFQNIQNAFCEKSTLFRFWNPVIALVISKIKVGPTGRKFCFLPLSGNFKKIIIFGLRIGPTCLNECKILLFNSNFQNDINDNQIWIRYFQTWVK